MSWGEGGGGGFVCFSDLSLLFGLPHSIPRIIISMLFELFELTRGGVGGMVSENVFASSIRFSKKILLLLRSIQASAVVFCHCERSWQAVYLNPICSSLFYRSTNFVLISPFFEGGTL